MGESLRRDAGTFITTDRDTLALQWIAEQYCIAFDQLQRLLAFYAEKPRGDLLAPTSTRNVVRRWLALGYIEIPRKIIAGYPPFFWLSRKGLAQLDIPYPYYQPRPSSIKHRYAVNAIRLAMQTHGIGKQATWRAQRLLAKDTNDTTLPDADLCVGRTPLIALRVIDQSPSNLSEERAKVLTYASRYARLWYFLQGQTIPLMYELFRSCDEEVQQALVLYSMDAQELPLLATVPSDPVSPS